MISAAAKKGLNSKWRECLELQQLRLFRRIINPAAEVFHCNGNFSTSGPEVPSEDLVDQRGGLSLPVEPADGNNGKVSDEKYN